MLGAFVNNELRGVANASQLPLDFPVNPGSYLFLMLIYSNLSNETITFRFYDYETDTVYDIYQTYVFIADMTIGDAFSPFIFLVDAVVSSSIFPAKAFIWLIVSSTISCPVLLRLSKTVLRSSGLGIALPHITTKESPIHIKTFVW